jgi:hypothetical protein
VQKNSNSKQIEVNGRFKYKKFGKNSQSTIWHSGVWFFDGISSNACKTIAWANCAYQVLNKMKEKEFLSD